MHRLHAVAPGCPDPIRILVVDDEPAMCELVSRILADAGYRVTSATSPDQALALVRSQGDPDLLVTDLKMPQMNGDALAARLRQNAPDLKVLYVTGFSQSLFETRGVLWAGEAFLDKPFAPAGLLEAVSQLLYDRVAPSVPGLPQPGGVLRSMFVALARNPRRDVV
jgi:two-component system, cell cycle sensor histidine kinase and response regulator CckA